MNKYKFPPGLIVAGMLLVIISDWCIAQIEYDDKTLKSLEKIKKAEAVEKMVYSEMESGELFFMITMEDSPYSLDIMLKEFRHREDAVSVFENWLDTAASEASTAQLMMAANAASRMDDRRIRHLMWRQASLRMPDRDPAWWTVFEIVGIGRLVTPHEEMSLLENLKKEIGSHEIMEKNIAERMAVLEKRIAEKERERPQRGHARDHGKPEGNSGTTRSDPERSPGRSWWPGIVALAVLLGSAGFVWLSKLRRNA